MYIIENRQFLIIYINLLIGETAKFAVDTNSIIYIFELLSRLYMYNVYLYLFVGK